MAGLQDTRVDVLYTLDETIAKDIFEGVTYPWEVLPKISKFIVALGNTLPEEIYEKLSYWVSAVFENETGMMGNLDPESFRWEKTCDLHNLREAMYGFAALLKRNPDDAKAKQGAEHLIDMVDRYTDFETGEWKCGLYEEECGGKVECGASSKQEIYRFSSTLGRYIGGLVRLYQVFPLGKGARPAELFAKGEGNTEWIVLEGSYCKSFPGTRTSWQLGAKNYHKIILCNKSHKRFSN